MRAQNVLKHDVIVINIQAGAHHHHSGPDHVCSAHSGANSDPPQAQRGQKMEEEEEMLNDKMSCSTKH